MQMTARVVFSIIQMYLTADSADIVDSFVFSIVQILLTALSSV